MIVFIILHYKNIVDTLECVESIRNLSHSESKIVVVENGSLDESTQLLKEMVGEIDVVFNENNYGFAKGNNLGIEYAKEKYDPNYYIIINNDIIITQPDMIEKIYDADQSLRFDVMGPKIITKNNINQNPSYQVLYKNKDILKHLLKLNVISILIDIRLYNLIKRFKKPIASTLSNNDTEKSIVDVPLHGSALIFSKRYIRKYKEPFDQSTFLYGEEEFLNYRRLKDELKFLYYPDIEVYHKEDASLNAFFGESNSRKVKFVIGHSRKSLSRFLRLKIRDKFRQVFK